MWITHSNKGTKIESDFWDWACMNKIITDYKEELGLSDDEAYLKFWEDLKNSDPEDYEQCLGGQSLEEAVGNGRFDESRASYLLTLDIVCERTEETP